VDYISKEITVLKIPPQAVEFCTFGAIKDNKKSDEKKEKEQNINGGNTTDNEKKEKKQNINDENTTNNEKKKRNKILMA